jgi:hypothetical protein
MEAADSYEALVFIFQAARYHKKKDIASISHCFQNLKCHVTATVTAAAPWAWIISTSNRNEYQESS